MTNAKRRSVSGNAANVTVNLIPPGALYGPRRNNLDFRVAKILRYGRTRTQVGIDIYNAADRQPENNRINWAALPTAWSALEQAIDVPKLGTFRVDHINLGARVKLSDVACGLFQ